VQPLRRGGANTVRSACRSRASAHHGSDRRSSAQQPGRVAGANVNNGRSAYGYNAGPCRRRDD
jgi:hypothetical protein